MAFPESQYNKERRLVTILFADLSGFTALSEKLDPEELSESLNICFEILNRIITDHGGMIHKYEGDSVLSIFGLPQAHEDDPERAVKTALSMMERMPEINKALSNKLKIKCELGLHAGVNLGTVFAGVIGSKEKKEYTIIGEAVNMASRLMGAAENGIILVSGRVFRQTRYLFEYQPLKPIKVKGISKSVAVFQPLKIKDKPDPKRGIEGLHSDMVGREKEFSVLCDIVNNLITNKKSGVTFILGEAGIGKSRLLEELKNYITTQSLPVKVLEGRCLSYGETISHFPVLEVLKNLFSITDQDSADTIRDKIFKTVQQLLPQTCEEVVPYIYYLFSVPLPAEYKEKVKHLEAEGLRLQIAIALKEVLESDAKKNPTLVVIDDYHWIDSASLDLLKFVFDSPADKSLLLLCLSRIEKESEGNTVKEHFRQRLGSGFVEIELAVLSKEASQQLTENLLKFSGLTTDIQKEILTKAAGNPLYLEEIIRSFIDAGLLIHEQGGWKSSEDLTISNIPDSIHEIIITRLDRLDSDLKNVLQKAAVIGRSFLVPLLERLTKIDSLMMSVQLATLEELEYIKILMKEPELEYIFKHPLVQEVAYSSLPRKNRRTLHGNIAEIIEDVFLNRVDEFTELLAHHYSNCNDPDKAIKWLEKAGLHAVDRYANEQAIAYFDRLINIIDQLPEPLEQHMWIQLKAYEALGDVCAVIGMYTKALEAFTAIGKKSTDMLVRGRALRKIGRVYWHQSDFTAAMTFLEKALAVLCDDTVDIRVEQAEIFLLQGAIYEIQGNVSRTRTAIKQALDTVANITINDRIKKIKANAMLHLGSIYRNQGEYDKAIDNYTKSQVLLKELNDKQVLANVMYLLGIVYHMRGNPQKAIDLNEESLAILEQIGDKKNVGRTCANLGVMYSYLGKRDKSYDFHIKSLRISLEIGDIRGESMAYSNLAKCYLGDEDYDKAHEYFLKNLVISEEIGDKTSLSASLGNLAILHTRTEEYDKAETYLIRAEKIIKELGNRQLLSTAYIHIAEVKRFKHEPAEEIIRYIDQAWAIAQEIGNKANQASCASQYAKTYAMNKDISRSEKYMQMAARLFTELGRFGILQDDYHKYAEILESVGEIDLARQYVQKSKELERQGK